ncbi:MAG: DUF1700 domain-containing protein [Clostridiales bacterium]|nr:DUF1700 domain-containing protein [Clostridiales bacterium]
MNRLEFLQRLQDSLSGEIPPESVRENLQYYNSYIREEKQKGRDEAEILEELGDPRLIARTIIDTTPGAGDGGFQKYRGDSGYGDMGGYEAESRGYSAESEDGQNGPRTSIHYYDLNKWYWKLLGIVVAIGLLMLVFAIFTGILTILIPILPMLVIVMAIMWVFGG